MSQGTIPALKSSALVTITEITTVQVMLSSINSKDSKDILLEMRKDQENVPRTLPS
jgi:hypothetical protein